VSPREEIPPPPPREKGFDPLDQQREQDMSIVARPLDNSGNENVGFTPRNKDVRCNENCSESYENDAGVSTNGPAPTQAVSAHRAQPTSAQPKGNSPTAPNPQSHQQIRMAHLAFRAGQEAAQLSVIQAAEGLVAIASSPRGSSTPGILLEQGLDGLRASDALRDQAIRAQRRAQELGAATKSFPPFSSDLSLLRTGAGGAVMGEFENLYGTSREDFAKKLMVGSRDENTLSAALDGTVPATTLKNVLNAGAQADPQKKEEVRRGARTGPLAKSLLEKLAAFAAESSREDKMAASTLMEDSAAPSTESPLSGMEADRRPANTAAGSGREHDPAKFIDNGLGGPRFGSGNMGGNPADFFGDELVNSLESPKTILLEGVQGNTEISLFAIVKKKLSEWSQREKAK
jgi:hypothetical protein